MDRERLTRRAFLNRTVVGMAGASLASFTIISPRAWGANDRLSIGLVGMGARMGALMQECHACAEKRNVAITAVCDIWTKALDEGAARVQKLTKNAPRKYRTIEELVTWNGLDAIIISTADFQHAKHCEIAVRAGKDVYVEKPLTNYLPWAKSCFLAVKETGRIVQLGTQRRSGSTGANCEAAAKAIAEGALGKIVKIEMIWNYFGPRWMRDTKGVEEKDILWKEFQMGRSDEPFNALKFRAFRIFWPYSSGIPCQWMSHSVDEANFVARSPYPYSAVSHGGIYVWKDGRQNPDTFETLIEYPQGFFYTYATRFGNASGGANALYGTEGTYTLGSSSLRRYNGKEIKLNPTPRGGHMDNWLECIRTRRQPNAPIETGYSHAVACILATRALHTGRKVYFDVEKQDMTFDPPRRDATPPAPFNIAV